MERKENKKMMSKLQKMYEEVKEELGLSGSVNDQVHALVDACDSIQGEIDKVNDSVRIDDLSKVQEITPIDRSTYLEFVNIMVTDNNGKMNDEKVDKFEQDFYQKLFITNLRHAFLNSYMKGDSIQITDDDNEKYTPYGVFESTEFDKLIKDSASKKDYVNNVLKPRYRKYATVAKFITGDKMTTSEFKHLVNFQHYKNGGYPNASTPSHLWSVFNKFNQAYRLLANYGYTDVNASLMHEFGLEVQTGESHPTAHQWQLS